MRLRSLSLVLAVALLACSSGLLLAIHLHEEGEGHDSAHCQVCLVLLHVSPAVASLGGLVLAGLSVVCIVAAIPESVVPAFYLPGTLGPRAPPSMA
jgi:hypothetical protein